jgi:hypothetical protein
MEVGDRLVYLMYGHSPRKTRIREIILVERGLVYYDLEDIGLVSVADLEMNGQKIVKRSFGERGH